MHYGNAFEREDNMTRKECRLCSQTVLASNPRLGVSFYHSEPQFPRHSHPFLPALFSELVSQVLCAWHTVSAPSLAALTSSILFTLGSNILNIQVYFLAKKFPWVQRMSIKRTFSEPGFVDPFSFQELVVSLDDKHAHSVKTQTLR